MRWKARDPYGWRRWFAWYPVALNGHWIWLEWLEVRQQFVMGGGVFTEVREPV